MPTCDPLILTPACREIIAAQPRSVLDVGIGYGKWGLLVREYAEVWKHHRLYREDWQVHLTGVEIHERYENPTWQLYDKIYRGDVTELPQQLSLGEGHFDLGIMIDVLEHIPREKAEPFLAWLFTVCRRVLISYSNHPQKAVGGNPHEDHVSQWSSSSFGNHSWRLLAGDDRTWGLFLVGDPR